MTPFQESLQGCMPALLTPLDKNFAVDAEALRRCTRRLLENGCRGVVVLGTSGEFAGIDDDQRETAIRAVVDEVAGAAPVMVGCGQPNVHRTHEQVRAAAEKCKNNLRGVRQPAMKQAKGHASKDVAKRQEKAVQDAHDATVKKVDAARDAKEKEIMAL